MFRNINRTIIYKTEKYGSIGDIVIINFRRTADSAIAENEIKIPTLTSHT